jgi:hypothetical protein
MAMSNEELQAQYTQHALLVAWGWFAESIGLIQALLTVVLHQKEYTYKPQTKVVEFLVAILGGLKYLQDISRSAHPLDQDAAVAEAWGQPGWADYSGVSRTLSGLSWAEAQAIAAVLEQVSRPLIQGELDALRVGHRRVRLDGDLTGLPVSNSSQTYPNAAFGHMDDEIRLGYQAAVVSMEGDTYRRLWLSTAHLSGDTVSCTQAEALVLAAEARMGLRPRRRTELLQQRVEAFAHGMETTRQRLRVQQEAVRQAHTRLAEAQQQVLQRQALLSDLEERYRVRQRPERPTSQLALARKGLHAAHKRVQSRERVLQSAERRLAKTEAQWKSQQEELHQLQQRLARFEQENATNPAPLEAEFRLDAGFGTYENVALLIEMGYEVYTKAHNHRVAACLKEQTGPQTTWTRVGANAEMVAWKDLLLKNCSYPLDVGLERFYTGPKLKHSALLHFGADRVTGDLPAWFKEYNARQTIEAGIKEGKQVFYLHQIKVRSEPAIYLQECLVLFAANFIRWATHWLINQTQASPNRLDLSKMGVKRQVQVGAHVSAEVIRDSQGKLLKFSEHSAFAGKVLRLHGCDCSPPCAWKSFDFGPFFAESHLIAQPLR